MSQPIKYWVIFIEGINHKEELVFFSLTYSGKRIIWEYLFDLIEDEYDIDNVKINGYNRINKRLFDRINSDEDNSI